MPRLTDIDSRKGDTVVTCQPLVCYKEETRISLLAASVYMKLLNGNIQFYLHLTSNKRMYVLRHTPHAISDTYQF